MSTFAHYGIEGKTCQTNTKSLTVSFAKARTSRLDVLACTTSLTLTTSSKSIPIWRSTARTTEFFSFGRANQGASLTPLRCTANQSTMWNNWVKFCERGGIVWFRGSLSSICLSSPPTLSDRTLAMAWTRDPILKKKVMMSRA
jgi:hypothetical protein